MSESFVINREQCPKCAAEGHDNSEDNLARYNDGHAYCYRCKYYEKGNNVIEQRKPIGDWKPLYGEYKDLSDRRLQEATLRKFSYQVIDHPEKGCVHVANFYVNSSLAAQKFRGPDKQFKWRGESRSAGLFGQHLFDGSNSRRLVITEGEIDAMSVYQANGGWPVVSLNGGTGNAINNIKDNLEWISKFPEIILMFDSDDVGRETALNCAQLLPPGRVKIATVPRKDANECLKSNDSKSIVNAIFQAKVYSPDEILHVADIAESFSEDTMEVYAYPWDNLSEFLLGQRSGEVSLWCSGTGSGKSTILREVAHHHLEEGRSVGMIMLEESPEETRDDMISLLINKPVRAIRATKIMNNLRKKMGKEPISIEFFDDLSDEEYSEAKKSLEDTNLYIYDHLGNSAMTNIIARMEYMAVSLGVDTIILDHITALAAGMMVSKDDESTNERILIDTVMKQLRALAVRTGVHIDIVSQLKKTDKAFEEGTRITLQDLRGSGSLASVPNTIIALERDRQADCEYEANTTTVRVLKNRLTGRSGVASCLYYNRNAGRLKEVDFQLSEGQVVLNPNT